MDIVAVELMEEMICNEEEHGFIYTYVRQMTRKSQQTTAKPRQTMA
jgi:hypothetical protein